MARLKTSTKPARNKIMSRSLSQNICRRTANIPNMLMLGQNQRRWMTVKVMYERSKSVQRKEAKFYYCWHFPDDASGRWTLKFEDEIARTRKVKKGQNRTSSIENRTKAGKRAAGFRTPNGLGERTRGWKETTNCCPACGRCNRKGQNSGQNVRGIRLFQTYSKEKLKTLYMWGMGYHRVFHQGTWIDGINKWVVKIQPEFEQQTNQEKPVWVTLNPSWEPTSSCGHAPSSVEEAPPINSTRI